MASATGRNEGEDQFMPTEEEYRALSAEALAGVSTAKSDSERLRLRRASGAYLKLATSRAEAAVRAADAKAERLTPEKPKVPKDTVSFRIR
jgi:hypothetical protein